MIAYSRLHIFDLRKSSQTRYKGESFLVNCADFAAALSSERTQFTSYFPSESRYEAPSANALIDKVHLHDPDSERIRKILEKLYITISDFYSRIGNNTLSVIPLISFDSNQPNTDRGLNSLFKAHCKAVSFIC